MHDAIPQVDDATVALAHADRLELALLDAEVFADVGPGTDQLVELFDALTHLRRAAGDFELTPEPATN